MFRFCFIFAVEILVFACFLLVPIRRRHYGSLIHWLERMNHESARGKWAVPLCQDDTRTNTETFGELSLRAGLGAEIIPACSVCASNDEHEHESNRTVRVHHGMY